MLSFFKAVARDELEKIKDDLEKVVLWITYEGATEQQDNAQDGGLVIRIVTASQVTCTDSCVTRETALDAC